MKRTALALCLALVPLAACGIAPAPAGAPKAHRMTCAEARKVDAELLAKIRSGGALTDAERLQRMQAITTLAGIGCRAG